MVFLIGSSACGSASGQASGILAEPTTPNITADSDARQATSLQLKGVLVSKTSRTALINSQVLQEGDRVGGVQILAIDQGGVRVLIGARELTVDVGSTIVPPAPFQEKSSSHLSVDVQHAVKSGETLSGIAQKYRRDGVTPNQMMIALFQANPRAFDDNINVLHAGAVLRIPDENELRRQTPETATAQVARHTDTWRVANQQRSKFASLSGEKQYGPVESGETLSGIALKLHRDGVTPNQMIIALFQANPQAFDDNINVLHAGAVLRIPNEHELQQHAPETATAEVLGQTKAWRQGYEQRAAVTLAHNNVRAVVH